MKVLFLSSWFPSRTSPFNGDFVERHALAVSEICHAAVIHVQTDHHIQEKVFEVFEKYNQSLFEIVVYFKRNCCRIGPLARMINLIRYGRGYLIACRILKNKFGRPDIIHANIISPLVVIARLWSIMAGIPYIISEHWTAYLSEKNRQIPSGWLIRQAVKKAFAVTVVTKNLGTALRKHKFENRFIVVPNVVDTDVFIPGPERLPADKFRFLHVSSMKEEHKNITGLIRTVKSLLAVRSDFMITFVGNAQPHQKALAVELGIPEQLILFRGEIPHAEVAEIMHQSDILIMFSHVENLPCVILEAMSCGLPVISSDVGGIHEWIRESNGMLVKPRDEEALLKAMVFMMDNIGKFNKHDLHQFAVDHFGKSNIAGRFYEIYKAALNQ
jgi:glycosyltransferase involved in cell wall biosynthesis